MTEHTAKSVSSDTGGYHRPIMVKEVLAGLDIKHGGLYFDGTVGGGGHSYAILQADPTVRLVATDKDDDAIAETERRLKCFEGRYRLVRTDYKQFENALAPEEKLDGFLLDFGISSHQIDDGARGFSYRTPDAPLDMRMDRRSPLTAEDVVNGYSEERLIAILRGYGEEQFAPSIVRNIVRARAKKRITTCGELKMLTEEGIPPKFRSAACARKTFQAIRIEVNGELEGLEQCVRGLIGRLKVGGRACILTFHSLEDRIVKQVFKDLSSECVCPKNFPVCVCGKRKQIEIIGKKPLVASEEEMKINPRSKSAKLRIAEKIAE